MPRQADRQQQIDVGDDRIGLEEAEGSGGIDFGHLRHVGEAEHRNESFANRNEVIGSGGRITRIAWGKTISRKRCQLVERYDRRDASAKNPEDDQPPGETLRCGRLAAQERHASIRPSCRRGTISCSGRAFWHS